MNTQEWKDFLKKSNPTEDEWKKASENSNHWFCCALGSKLFLNPPDLQNMTQDCKMVLNSMVVGSISPKAEKLGMSFWSAIDDENIKRAREIFKIIHELKVKKLA